MQIVGAFVAGMVYAISCQGLPFQHKKRSTTGRSWHGKAKKICNIATVLSQICNSTVALLQIQKLLFYSPLSHLHGLQQYCSTFAWSHMSHILSPVSHFLSLFRIYYYFIMQIYYFIVQIYYFNVQHGKIKVEILSVLYN